MNGDLARYIARRRESRAHSYEKARRQTRCTWRSCTAPAAAGLTTCLLHDEQTEEGRPA